MKNLFITKGNTQVAFYIQVEGYPTMGYLYYTTREAITKYRREYGLEHKHLNIIDLRKA